MEAASGSHLHGDLLTQSSPVYLPVSSYSMKIPMKKDPGVPKGNPHGDKKRS